MEKYKYSDEELSFMEHSSIPFAVYQFINKRVVTLALSEGFFEIFGYTGMSKQDVYDLMDRNMYRDTHPDDLAIIGDAAYRFATEGGIYDVIYRTKKDNEYRIIHSYGKHVYKENGVRLAFVWYADRGVYVEDGKNDKNSLLNIFKNQLAGRSLNIKLGHDYLTGLPSMTYFFELAEAGCRELRQNGKTPVILFLDFNGMKGFNQKYGLEEGDKYLKAFSEEIVEIFSHENCSRFNADHFCVYTDQKKAEEGTARLIAANNNSENKKKMPLRIGVFIYDDEGISISGACDRAKMACDSGRKQFTASIYHFTKEMLTTLEKKQYVIENIDRAIQEGWICVYYQPIIRTANGRVCAEEALARWIDPDKGFLSPADFIPALEESNSIYKLDLYVVESVLKKMKTQAENGLYIVPESINLSRSDFYTCDIVEEIKKRVDKAAIPRNRIAIEITESTIANDLEYMIKEIKRFKSLGFTVWMDDYGSGYSSPIILQKIPFDLIKIDMLFVRQLDEGEKAKIVLTEIVRMAMFLGMDTIAEGVETKEQLEFLKEIGCTMLQGFYFCKPVSLPQIIERYQKGIQIGFENPAESDYYAQLGKVNLYDLSISSTDDVHLRNYFDTCPMIMLECNGNKLSVIRCNTTFKKFIKIHFPNSSGISEFDATNYLDKPGGTSLNAVLHCANDGKRIILEDRTVNGKVFQLFIWRIAVNPVTKIAAVMVTILSSSEEVTEQSGAFVKLQQENARLKEEVDANRKIAELKESVSSLLINMPAMTFSKDMTSGKYLACNQSFAEYAHKKTPEDVIGLTDFEIFDYDTALHFVDDDKKALSMEKPYIFLEDVRDAVGNQRQFQTTKFKFIDNSGKQCLLGLCQDVTDAMRVKREYVERLAQVQSQAKVDSLTGVKNKNAYQEAEELLNHRIMEHRPPNFAITVLDVNDLKKINDTKGHKAGDEYICNACKIICKTFKHSPVFRIGGDEFAVISQNEDFDHIHELIDRIANYNDQARQSDKPVIACGMAIYTDEDCVASVFIRADKKMYENKKHLKSSC